MGEVICVGLSRTGTSSLKAALSQLLPGRTYHAMDLLQTINDVETFNFWKKLSEETASKEEIQDFFCNRRYSAVCDIPCLQYWRQISAEVHVLGSLPDHLPDQTPWHPLQPAALQRAE